MRQDSLIHFHKSRILVAAPPGYRTDDLICSSRID
jgi:hypothetical protein